MAMRNLVEGTPTLTDLEGALATLLITFSEHSRPSDKWWLYEPDPVVADAQRLVEDPIAHSLHLGLRRLVRVVFKLYGPEALDQIVARVRAPKAPISDALFGIASR
jgi:hypothetical protein